MILNSKKEMGLVKRKIKKKKKDKWTKKDNQNGQKY